jgi:hypothetical protein
MTEVSDVLDDCDVYDGVGNCDILYDFIIPVYASWTHLTGSFLPIFAPAPSYLCALPSLRSDILPL